MAGPNLIWIFGDQHRAQALGFRGDPNVSTPNLDRLATEGLSCNRALTNSPLCCPARGSLLTGLYPHRAVDGHEVQLNPQIPTVAHAFRDHGYRTAWFGKWHLDGFHERHGRAAFHVIPPERRGGFETWVGYENNNSPFDSWVHGHNAAGEFAPRRLPGHETDALTDEFIHYLENAVPAPGREAAPFFAALSVQPPHDPYVAPEQFMAGKSAARITFRPNVPEIPHVREQAARELAGYYAAIENLDWNVGRIVAALERLGLYGNTHILFFSDHGDMHGSHGMFRKTNPYEESIRTPLIISGLDHAYRFRTGPHPGLVTNVDLAPTSLGLCGLPVPAGMQGRDLSAIRRWQDAPTDSAFIQLVKPTGHHDSTDRPWRGMVTDDGWKYICLEGQPWLLFNLNDDPYEQANLAQNSRYRDQRQRLHARLQEWIESTGDNFTLPALA